MEDYKEKYKRVIKALKAIVDKDYNTFDGIKAFEIARKALVKEDEYGGEANDSL